MIRIDCWDLSLVDRCFSCPSECPRIEKTNHGRILIIHKKSLLRTNIQKLLFRRFIVRRSYVKRCTRIAKKSCTGFKVHSIKSCIYWPVNYTRHTGVKSTITCNGSKDSELMSEISKLDILETPGIWLYRKLKSTHVGMQDTGPLLGGIDISVCDDRRCIAVWDYTRLRDPAQLYQILNDLMHPTPVVLQNDGTIQFSSRLSMYVP